MKKQRIGNVNWDLTVQFEMKCSLERNTTMENEVFSSFLLFHQPNNTC